MERVKVSKIAKQIRGVSYKPEDLHDMLDDNSVTLLRANNIQDGKVDFEDVLYVDKSKVSQVQYLQKGDILVCASSGSKSIVGKAASIDFDGEYTFGAFCKVVRPIPEMADYLGVYFQSQIYRGIISKVAMGANINNIRNEHIDNLEIPAKTSKEISGIVQRVKLLQYIIDHRKLELQKLDELVKARFVEMFICKDNPMVTLDSLTLGKSEYGAQSASAEYDSNRPRYIRITDINDDGTLNNDIVSSANIEDDQRYKLTYGDFLFARMGATVGKTYAYKSGDQIFAGYLIRYKLNLQKIMPEYLFAYTKLEKYKKWVLLNQSGAAQPGINAKKYGSLQIPLAPLEEQRAFTNFVRQTDKSRLLIRKSLEQMETLKKALMQQYFG